MNSIKSIYSDFPIDKPILTIISILLISAILAIGSIWIVIDDDFVKMFPDNIPSKKVWDDIQEEFGSTEYLIIAVEHDNILNDLKFYDSIQRFSSEVKRIKDSNGNQIIDRVLSIDESEFFNSDKKKQKIADYEHIIKDQFIHGELLSIAIVPKSNINNAELVDSIKQVYKRELGNYKSYFAGQPYLTGETPNLIKKDIRVLMIIGVCIMIFVLAINLRSFYAVLCVFCVIFLALIGMIGFMGWLFKITGDQIFNFTILSTSMPIILLTIANSDGVHITSRFAKQLKKTKDVKQSIKLTIQKLRTPIFLTSLTTAIAFTSMIFSPIPHMMGFGIVISFGVLWAWIVSTTLLPSLLLIKNWNLQARVFNEDNFIEKLVGSISRYVTSNPKKTLFSGLVIVFISLVGFWFIKVEVNIIKFFKEDTQIRQSTNFVDNNMNGSMNFIVRARGDFINRNNLKLIEELQLFLESEIPEIQKTVSLADIVKKSQYKFLVEDDIKNYKELESYRLPDSDDEILFCLTFPVDSGIDQDSYVLSLSNIANLSNMWDNEPFINETVILAQMKTVSTDRASEIADIVSFKIDSITKDQDVHFEATGLLVFLKDFVSMVVKSSVISIVTSVFAILFIIYIFFRRTLWAFLSVIPLLSAITLNFGLMGLLGVELSHLTALLTSVIIGVGADFSIHYISDYNNNLKSGIDQQTVNFHTSNDVGYPILLDVASNMGFAALLFSAIIPINYIGGLMVFAMISTSFGTLTILSSTIELLKKKI
ncbi:MAG: hypothetical protein CMG11_01705 [Candidatus Marinimicrobia bacterium]|nr:hypothetical protein [Candidatus Neomarinimicrobiota bacterium]